MLSLGVSVPALVLVAVGLLTYVTLLVASLRRRSADRNTPADAEPTTSSNVPPDKPLTGIHSNRYGNP